MGLADLVRSKVALADSLTKDLQPTVVFKAWIGQDGYGADSYASPVNVRALVDRSRKQLYTKGGNMVMTLAQIFILEPIAFTTAAGTDRVNPVDPRDIFTLSDGTTGPIVDINGFEDAGASPTGQPFLNVVSLGSVMSSMPTPT